MKHLMVLFILSFPALVFCQQNEEVYKIVEEMPRFPGCEDMEGTVKELTDCSNDRMINFISKNLKYPAKAKENKVEGMVVVQFIIRSDGSVTDTKLVRDIGEGCGDEAIRVIMNMNQVVTRDTVVIFDEDTYVETVKVIENTAKWRPGYQRGKAVDVLFTLPMTFKL